MIEKKLIMMYLMMNNKYSDWDNPANSNSNSFGGVAVWEYFNAPPSSPQHPYVWCEIMSHILNS